MSRVDADDELLASVTRKLHFKLSAFLRLIIDLARRSSRAIWSSSRSPILMVRLRTVACVSVGSTGRNSASTVAACRYGIRIANPAFGGALRQGWKTTGDLGKRGGNSRL
ncbi:hypothetical protein [Ensifer sp. SL37]|uniref:hypothetical protein n=1 Tax=Ensifer sp. SL37 TaxID=2995137 RepID=UPI00227647D5|nr:hypothetical protein [Ensifer sp. SL37]MCY1745388.1 hypothetical protein [Ensifer sp. SL37]